MHARIVLRTPGPGLHEITAEVAPHARGTGMLTLFCRHTSCALLVQENADPDVRRDLDAFFSRLVPRADAPAMSFLRHRSEGPDDMPSHIRASMLPAALTIPVEEGRMLLGTWQGIYLWELRDAPHRREIVATMA